MGNGRRTCTAREKVLDHGLFDCVDLARIHWFVRADTPGAQLPRLQDHTLALIRSLLSEGLFEVGDLSGAGGQFVAWDTPLDESMQRIPDLYVERYDDRSDWPWAVWLGLTAKGLPVARAVEGGG